MGSRIESLPTEILAQILVRLDFKEARNMRPTSKRLRTAVNDLYLNRVRMLRGISEGWVFIQCKAQEDFRFNVVVANRMSDDEEMSFEINLAEDDNPIDLILVSGSTMLFKEENRGFRAYNMWSMRWRFIAYPFGVQMGHHNTRAGTRLIQDPTDGLHNILMFFNVLNNPVRIHLFSNYSQEIEGVLPESALAEAVENGLEENQSYGWMLLPFEQERVAIATISDDNQPIYRIQPHNVHVNQFIPNNWYNLPVYGLEPNYEISWSSCSEGYIALTGFRRYQVAGGLNHRMLWVTVGERRQGHMINISTVPRYLTTDDVGRFSIERLRVVGGGRYVDYTVLLTTDEGTDYMLFRRDLDADADDPENGWQVIRGEVPYQGQGLYYGDPLTAHLGTTPY